MIRDRGTCQTCGVETRVRSDGTPHNNHACWMKWSGERAPWPFTWAREAAVELGVREDFINGVATRPNSPIRSCRLVKLRDVGAENAPSRNAYNTEDLRALAARLRA